MEVAPGIHRIEADLGERFVCQYLLVGEERTLLVDTGLRDTPRDVIAPHLARLGRALADVDDVLISHADVDHCGGNASLRAAAPRARLLCGEDDRAWIESSAAMLAGNYRWYESYGFGPAAEDLAFIQRELGGDAAVDVGLRGGETLRLGPNRRPGARAAWSHTWAPRTLGPRRRRGDHPRRGARGRRLRSHRSSPDPASLLRGTRLRGDGAAASCARYRPAVDRALARHGPRGGARVPGRLARVHRTGALGRPGRRAEGRHGVVAADPGRGRGARAFPEFAHELAASVRAHLAEV